MAVLVALAAALCFAAGTMLQQKVAAQASDDEAVIAGFLVRLAREPLWLAGIAVDGLGFVFQALSLKVGQPAVVQPLLAATMRTRRRSVRGRKPAPSANATCSIAYQSKENGSTTRNAASAAAATSATSARSTRRAPFRHPAIHRTLVAGGPGS